jgi:hypothetical protein
LGADRVDDAGGLDPEAGVRQWDGRRRGAGAHHRIDRIDGERLDAHPYLTGPGLGHGLVDDAQHLRPAELVEDDDSWHGGSFVSGVVLASPR